MAGIVDPYDTPQPAGIVDPYDTPSNTLVPQSQEDPEYEGGFQEFFEGVGSGAIGIVQGIGELAGMGIDAIADTDTSSAVTEIAEDLRDSLGLDPAGIIGKGTELVTQFVVPGLGAAKVVNMAAKAARAQRGLAAVPMTNVEKFGSLTKELAAAGAVDAVVTNNGMNTVADFFDGGYTQTDQTMGLTGREEAARRFNNRLKVAAEAVAFGGVATGVLKGIGAGGKVAMGTAPGKATLEALKKPGKKLDELEARRIFAGGTSAELSGVEKAVAETFAGLRYRSFLPEEVANQQNLISSRTQPDLKRAERSLKRLNLGMDSILKKTGDEGVQERKILMNSINEYITAPIKKGKVIDPIKVKEKERLLQLLPTAIRGEVKGMRVHVDELTDSVLSSNFLKDVDYIDAKTQRKITDVIEENIGGYLRRRYRVFEDSKFTPGQDEIDAAKKFFKTDKRNIESELTKLKKYDPDLLNDAALKRIGAEMRGNKVKMLAQNVRSPTFSDEAAELAQESFLKRYQLKARKKGSIKGGFVAKDRLQTGMFVERRSLDKTLRSLLGEVDDPQEAYLGTISDLAQFKATDNFFGSVKKMALDEKGVGRFFIDPKTTTKYSASQLRNMLDSGDFVELGGAKAPSTLRGSVQSQAGTEALDRSGWGSLNGMIVPSRIHKDLSNLVVSDDNSFATAARTLYGGFLKAKGISQYSKTVLSPVTQLRNFTTSSMFALSQGNIGRGANLYDSMKLVFDDATGSGADQFAKDIDDMTMRGVLGTNTELREIQDLIRKGDLLETSSQPKSAAEALLGKNLSQKVTDNKLARGGGKALKGLEKLYQGSDDVWKAYNFKFETNKLRNALNGVSEEDKIKYLTKNMTDIEIDKATAIQNGMPLKGRIPNANGTIDDLDLVDELIKDRAGQIVRDTVPNYNKAPLALRFARRLPLGNFITFPYEIYRTGANTLKQSLDEMNSGVGTIRAIGQRRLMGLMSATIVVPQATAMAAYAVSGISRDEMKAYQRSFGAEWEKNAMLIPVRREEDGRITYINLSTSNPYDTLFSMVTAANNSIGTDGKLDKSPEEIMVNAVEASLGEFFDPFLSPAMITEALVDITQRNGKTSTGSEVYNQQDPLWEKRVKSFKHLFETVIPSGLPIQVTSGEFEPSRFARAVLGPLGVIDQKDKLGRERKVEDEIIRLTGFAVSEFDPERSLKFAVTRKKREQTDAKRIFNTVTDDANAGTSTYINAYSKANAAKMRVDKEYYQILEDAKMLGMTNNQIKKIFKENKVGGVGGILKGKFEPFKVSPESGKKAFRAGNKEEFKQAIPFFKQMFKEGKGLGLAVDPEESTYVPLLDKNPEVVPSLPQAPSTLPSTVNPFDSLDIPSSRNPFLNLPTLPPGPTLLPNPQDQEIQRRLTP